MDTHSNELVRLVDKSISSDGAIVVQNNFELAGPSSTWENCILAARQDFKLRQWKTDRSDGTCKRMILYDWKLSNLRFPLVEPITPSEGSKSTSLNGQLSRPECWYADSEEPVRL